MKSKEEIWTAYYNEEITYQELLELLFELNTWENTQTG